MNKLLLVLMLLVALSACKKNNENKIQDNDVPNLEISVSALKTTPNNTNPEGDATYNLLGYGYDITDKYASRMAVRERVIDVPLFVANNDSEAFSKSNSTECFSMSLNGISASALSARLSEKYDVSGGLNVFKSTIVSSFPENDALSKKYGYGYFSEIFIRRKLRIEAAKGSNSLTNTFTLDVATLSAEQLVKKYGTHIMQRIHIGTRINAIYQAEVPENEERQLAVKEGFTYVIYNVFGVLPFNDGPYNVEALNTNSSVKLRYEVIGGEPREIKELDVSGIRRIMVDDWNKSANESNYRFIDFDQDGLIPLYDLIVDNAKKAIVKDFIIKYISDNQVKTKE
ncbi:MAC/perforin domain-containing protein [Arcticibacter eurypsychrophilus]|uniref:MAC/perforin domain-containing protein n=1 Tax=Arcticibacter eurypsychrophilus TaxID=1434752 RepID=UPI00084D0FF4|nr:MAC/perforin domain-containing protein [Arcticibacter eurypsychrophilus]